MQHWVRLSPNWCDNRCASITRTGQMPKKSPTYRRTGLQEHFYRRRARVCRSDVFWAEISIRPPQEFLFLLSKKILLGSKYPKKKKKKKKWYCSACTAHGDPALTNRCSADDTLPARCRWLCFTTSSEATSQYQREADWWSIDKATRHHLLLSVVGLCLCVCVQQREC